MPKQEKALKKMVRERDPTITLDMKTLPEMKTWEVGEKYKIVLDVKMVGKRQREETEDDFQPSSFGEFSINKASSK